MSTARTQRTSTEPHELAMPRLSDSMEEGTVVEWLIAVGDEVREGDEIATIETDKATVPLEATGSGVLTEIAVAAGETAALGAVLARLNGGTAAAADVVAPIREPRAKASPIARRIAGQHGIDLFSITGRGPNGRIVKADVEALLATADPANGGSSRPAEIRPTRKAPRARSPIRTSRACSRPSRGEWPSRSRRSRTSSCAPRSTWTPAPRCASS